MYQERHELTHIQPYVRSINQYFPEISANCGSLVGDGVGQNLDCNVAVERSSTLNSETRDVVRDVIASNEATALEPMSNRPRSTSSAGEKQARFKRSTH